MRALGSMAAAAATGNAAIPSGANPTKGPRDTAGPPSGGRVEEHKAKMAQLTMEMTQLTTTVAQQKTDFGAWLLATLSTMQCAR